MGCIKMGFSANCGNHNAKVIPFSAFQISGFKNLVAILLLSFPFKIEIHKRSS
jgi:hypothetical protein